MKYFLGLEDYTPTAIATKTTQRQQKKTLTKSPHSINLSYFKKTASEIKIINPRKFSEAIKAVNHLKEDIPVIINLKLLDSNQCKRFMDFISGSIFSINGQLTKLDENFILITSEKTTVTEDRFRTNKSQKRSDVNQEIIANYIANN